MRLNGYLEWLAAFVCDDDHEYCQYQKLFSSLLNWDFTPKYGLDSNRWNDGLRIRDMYERKIGHMAISGTCTVLEMLVALSIKCEEYINGCSEGNYSFWFWEMIDNLGLIDMDDFHFDEEETDVIIQMFIDREYGPNGEYNLFHLNAVSDIRKYDIWEQFCIYSNEQD